MLEKQELLYEGKAKKLYGTSDPNVLWVEYKDSATALNGQKKAIISGKGELNNAISALIFRFLTQEGLENHFIEQLSSTEHLVQRVQIIPLEVVVRNIAAGSLCKRLGVPEGEKLKRPLLEFYLKSDELGDPLINEDHIAVLDLATSTALQEIRATALKVNKLLTELFLSCNLLLVDFKLEFGMRNNELLLADEISPDTCRLWDGDTQRKLDKDVFRQDLGDLTEGYREVLKRLGGIVHV